MRESNGWSAIKQFKLQLLIMLVYKRNFKILRINEMGGKCYL